MLFHSFGFFVFFWIVFAVYWALPRLRLRNGWLVAASCVFYGTWNPWLVSLILFTASVDYVIALQLMSTRIARDAARASGDQHRRQFESADLF